MFHCYLFPCLSPQILPYKHFSKGRKGWNCGSARSHSFQSHFFSAVVGMGKKKKKKKENPLMTTLDHMNWAKVGLNWTGDRM
jgi:hypothetical protein